MLPLVAIAVALLWLALCVGGIRRAMDDLRAGRGEWVVNSGEYRWLEETEGRRGRALALAHLVGSVVSAVVVCGVVLLAVMSS